MHRVCLQIYLTNLTNFHLEHDQCVLCLLQDDQIGRIEDQIIARTWRWYIEGVLYHPDVIVLNPMVRVSKQKLNV